MNRRPDWTPGWTPQRRVPQASPFGGDLPSELVPPGTDAPPRIVRLEGGFVERFPDIAAAPPSGVQRIEVIEPSNGWWTQEGAFGFRYQGQIPPLAGTVIPLTEQLRLPGPPREWWIHWFRYSRGLETEASPSYGQWDLRGRVTYGVGGVQNIVEVDVMSGIQLPIIANSIKVDLVTYAPQRLADGTEPYDPGEIGVIAGAMFGDGAGGGALPATWSSQIFTCDGAGVMAQDVVVPDFARSLVLHTNISDPAALAGVDLFFNTPGFAEKVINVEECYHELVREKGIALPAHTNQIRINSAAAGPLAGAYFSLQFFLAL